jgi:hypothetical protein
MFRELKFLDISFPRCALFLGAARRALALELSNDVEGVGLTLRVANGVSS